MPWVYLDDHIDEHDKTIEAGDAAFGFWVRLLAFCRRKQNGGRIPKGYERLRGQRSKVERLLKVGYLEDQGDHYQVHDYDVIYFKEDEERRRRSDKARRAAEARWDAQSNAQASAEQCSSNARTVPRTRERAPDPTPHTPEILTSSPTDSSVAPNGEGGKRSPTTLEVLERMADDELRAAQQAGGVRSPKAWRKAKFSELDDRYGDRADQLVNADPALTPVRLRGVLTNAAVANGYLAQREAG